MNQLPVMIMKDSQKRESGRKVQLSNIAAARTVSEIVATCLGPKAMLKMLMDPMGGIVITNDGNAILREIQVQHPAAKSLIEVARTQDEQVGDGTTSVVVLAGELLSQCEPLLNEKMHPLHIIKGIRLALDDLLEFVRTKLALPIDPADNTKVMTVLKSCLGTKISDQWSDLACGLAWKAVRTIALEAGSPGELNLLRNRKIDIKRYARVEKIPGGAIEDSVVLDGVVLNKDVLHPSMRRRIVNPRILLLDCGLEYKKGESQTNVEIMNEQDFTKLLQIEEQVVKEMCMQIIKLKPDLVITEKGCSDLAMYFLSKAGISVLRRLKKTDNNRIARAVNAVIVSNLDEAKEEDIGTECGLFEVKKIGDEYFAFLVECKNPKACSVILRGASKEVLNEIERNLHDAMCVARNLILEPSVVTGGGSFEMACACYLEGRSNKIGERCMLGYKAAGKSLEVIPRILAKNCGNNAIKVLTELRAKHNGRSFDFGVDGETGKVVNMREGSVFDSTMVKVQVVKVAFEVVTLLLKIDDIVSGTKNASEPVG